MYYLYVCYVWIQMLNKNKKGMIKSNIIDNKRQKNCEIECNKTCQYTKWFVLIVRMIARTRLHWFRFEKCVERREQQYVFQYIRKKRRHIQYIRSILTNYSNKNNSTNSQYLQCCKFHLRFFIKNILKLH